MVQRIAIIAIIGLTASAACIGAAVSWGFTPHAPAHPQIVLGDGTHGPLGMAWVAGGQFLMGSDAKQAQPNERPAHKVKVHGFWMDRHHVTNAEFRRFVEATGYVTTAAGTESSTSNTADSN